MLSFAINIEVYMGLLDDFLLRFLLEFLVSSGIQALFYGRDITSVIPPSLTHVRAFLF